MVLDEDNAVLYFRNRKEKLSEKQNLLLSYLINTPDKSTTMEEISKYVYGENECKRHNLNYDEKLPKLIYSINQKTSPDFKISCKYSKICYITTMPYNKKWLKMFSKAHENSYILLDKYKKMNSLKREIEELEKRKKKITYEIRTGEKYGKYF